MRTLAFRASLQRLAAAFLAARSRTQVILILSGFIPLRVFLSVKNGIIPEGDGTAEGLMLGHFWLGELTFRQLVDNTPVGAFLRQRSSQLLYPLLISFQPAIGWDIRMHLLVLNTILGSIFVIGAYGVGLRMHGKSYAVLVAFLMCSLTAPYWIARMGLIDNAFYAVLPLFALSVVTWLRSRTPRSLALMIVAAGALAVTRPESILVIGAVALVFAWKFFRRFFARRTVAAALLFAVAVAAAGTVLYVRSSPALQTTLLSTGSVSNGLAASAETLFNRGWREIDHLTDMYQPKRHPDASNLSLNRSLDAIEVIKADPLGYVAKIPIRALALLYPWTYQLWSLPHALYEAAYTIFLTGGVVLLARRSTPDTVLLALGVIPLTILCFLSAYGIDNDLKHRTGVLVALNMIAPLGYFVKSRRPERV